MTSPRDLVLLVVVVLSACGGRPVEPQPTGARVELPPPVVGGPAPTPSAAPQIPEAPSVPWLRFYVGASQRGALEACGCPGLPSGGLPRRSTFAEALRTSLPDVPIVEGPELLMRSLAGTEQPRGEDRTRARLVLDLLAATRPLFWAPGQRDLEALPPDELVPLARRLGLPLLATNVDEAVLPGAARSWRIEADGRRALLLSLLGPARTSEAEGRVRRTDPVEAAASAVQDAAAAGGVDLVIVLTDARERDRARWMEAGLGADVIITPPSEDEPRARWVGRTLVARADPGGRALLRIDVAFTGPEGRATSGDLGGEVVLERFAAAEDLLLGRAWELGRRAARRAAATGGAADGSPPSVSAERMLQLRADRDLQRRRAVPGLSAHLVGARLRVLDTFVPEDAATLARVNEYQRRTLARIAETVSTETAPPNQLFAGRDACIACHAGIDAHWAQSTGHAGAWKTLVDRGQTGNPDCLRCHTTGFGVVGGFVDPIQDARLRGVQCEACHGPMATHVARAAAPGIRPDPGLPVAEATCLGCHDPLNSPSFDFPSYLAKVRHPGTVR